MIKLLIIILDICAIGNPTTLQPMLSACSSFSTGNLPIQCIEIIQVRTDTGKYGKILKQIVIDFRPCSEDSIH